MQCKLWPFYHDDDDDDDDGNDDLFKANNELIPLVVSTFVASHWVKRRPGEEKPANDDNGDHDDDYGDCDDDFESSKGQVRKSLALCHCRVELSEN